MEKLFPSSSGKHMQTMTINEVLRRIFIRQTWPYHLNHRLNLWNLSIVNATL